MKPEKIMSMIILWIVIGWLVGMAILAVQVTGKFNGASFICVLSAVVLGMFFFGRFRQLGISITGYWYGKIRALRRH
jgi:hypothetical protein